MRAASGGVRAVGTRFYDQTAYRELSGPIEAPGVVAQPLQAGGSPRQLHQIRGSIPSA